MSFVSTSKKTQIIILDPGLREHGGHHPAFILSLMGSEIFKDDAISLTVFANSEFEPSGIFDSLEDNQICDLIPFFDIDYYRYFYTSESDERLSRFIDSLTTQYLDAFIKGSCNNENLSKVFFIHTLGWEHASALTNAVYLYKKKTGLKLRLVVLLMFSPFRDAGAGKYDHAVYLKYTIAFKRLDLNNDISFFACDYETSMAYSHILKSNIEICPLPFIRYKDYHKRMVQKEKIALLYIGDSKANKGFLSLPILLEEAISSDVNSEFEYIIQYTLTNESAEFKEVDRILKEYAKQNPRVFVYDRFWSEEELHSTLAKSSIVVFNYDTHTYQFQSSGILWLAAQYDLSMLFLSENWLKREAARLGCDYKFGNFGNIHFKTQNTPHEGAASKRFCAKIITQNIVDYKAILFGDFNEWLLVNLIK